MCVLHFRSSCRKRRKTDFYVSTPSGANSDDGGEISRGRGKREKVAEPTRRKLFPGEPVTPLVVSPPDIPGPAMIHVVEREDSQSEPEGPNDSTVTVDKKNKKQVTL